MSHLVLFDVGGVLIKLDFGRFYGEAAKIAGVSLEEFRRRYLASNLESDSLTGLVRKYQYITKIRGMTDTSLSESEIITLCASRMGGPINEVVRIKGRVHESGYTVGIFSNIYDIGLEIIGKKWHEVLETYGGPRIFSFEVGAMKPDPEMYESVKGFDNVTFIDDRESYLRTGINRGWNGILFTAYVDESEALRAVAAHDERTKPMQNFREANSAEELEKALRYFGIRI